MDTVRSRAQNPQEDHNCYTLCLWDSVSVCVCVPENNPVFSQTASTPLFGSRRVWEKRRFEDIGLSIRGFSFLIPPSTKTLSTYNDKKMQLCCKKRRIMPWVKLWKSGCCYINGKWDVRQGYVQLRNTKGGRHWNTFNSRLNSANTILFALLIFNY